MNISENMERAIKDYGKEAFSDHKEETYAAIKAVCLCGISSESGGLGQEAGRFGDRMGEYGGGIEREFF